jgi:hypothetical protein
MALDLFQRLWVRWLHQGCLMPLEHVADVLELDPAEIAAYLAHKPRNGHRPPQPAGPPRKAGFANRPGLAIRGGSGRKIRRLRDLGYQGFQIALFLGIHVDDVREFIRRITPIRKAALNRPRERSVQLGLRPTLPRFVPPALAKIAADWNYRDRPVDVAELPAAAPIAVAVDNQVAVDAAVGARAATQHHRNSTAWVGPDTPLLRNPKLAGDQVDKAREMLRAGDSYPVVARRFGVSVNTLRTYVGDVGRRRSVPIYPTSAVAYLHGVVHWDKPMLHGRRAKVLVECQCGQERYIATHQVARAGREFTAGCIQCFPFTSYVGEPPLKPEQVIEAAAMRSGGCSWTELGHRYDLNRHTVRRAVERLLLTSPLPCPDAECPKNRQKQGKNGH